MKRKADKHYSNKMTHKTLEKEIKKPKKRKIKIKKLLIQSLVGIKIMGVLPI